MSIGSILIVDDEAVFRDMLIEMLKGKTSKAVAVESGSQALKVLSRNRFDIVITDVNMPDMNGYQLLEYIKFVDPIVPVIIMTGYNGIYDMQEAIEKGAEEYIVKPFKKEEIDALIDRVVLRSFSKRNKILLKYITVANNLITQSDEPNRGELIIIGRRLLKYIETPTVCPETSEGNST
jgi:DNA-binding NtrC family response regulator